jgi:hypothetical protein
MYRLPYYHLLSHVLMDISMGPLVKMQKLPNKKKHANMHIVYRFVSDTTVLCTCTRKHMSGGHNYLLLAIDMAKVGGLLSVVKVCTSTLCIKIGYR